MLIFTLGPFHGSLTAPLASYFTAVKNRYPSKCLPPPACGRDHPSIRASKETKSLEGNSERLIYFVPLELPAS